MENTQTQMVTGTGTNNYYNDVQPVADSAIPEMVESNLESFTPNGNGNGSVSRNTIRDLSIKELNKGYVVNVGCHSFAIETKESLIAKLSAYITDPNTVEAKWFKDNTL